MRARSPVTRVLIGALLVSAVGCSALMGPPAHVVIRFSPASPTHLETVATTAVVISGPVVAEVPVDKRRATRSERQVFDLERADEGDAYRVRYSINGQKAPYTVWLSPAAAVLRVIEDSGMPAAKSDLIPDAKELARVIGIPDGALGMWRIGESRIVPVSMPIGDSSVSFLTTRTLRRVGLFHDRAAAGFDYTATGTVTIASARVEMKFSGEEWRDLATGLSLKATSRGTGAAMFGAQRLVFDMDMTSGVDWEKSRL